mgnify:CR=1 FL=1
MLALNYVPEATIDDGSCDLPVFGCIDLVDAWPTPTGDDVNFVALARCLTVVATSQTFNDLARVDIDGSLQFSMQSY